MFCDFCASCYDVTGSFIVSRARKLHGIESLQLPSRSVTAAVDRHKIKGTFRKKGTSSDRC